MKLSDAKETVTRPVIGTVQEAYPLGIADQLSPSRIRAPAEADALNDVSG
jgi:hypothetical protein